MEPASREEMVEAACEQLGRLFDAGDREALISTIRQLLSAALEDNERHRVRVAESRSVTSSTHRCLLRDHRLV
jgi:DNA-binding transcriptional regulator LsrR (DeoR family)